MPPPQILVIDQLNAQILVLYHVYYIPLHVSSTVVLIIRRSKFYYTVSGIITLCRWPSGAQVEGGHSRGRPVHRLREHSPNLCTERSPIECDDTRPCIIQF